MNITPRLDQELNKHLTELCQQNEINSEQLDKIQQEARNLSSNSLDFLNTLLENYGKNYKPKPRRVKNLIKGIKRKLSNYRKK